MLMKKEYIEPFSNAFINIMPQLGVADVKLLSQEECGKQINAPGVVCIIGIIGDLHGNVIFAMHEDCAKSIASNMMGGMDVAEFDEIAQSAVSELGNMLAANACMDLSGMGITVDISTPTLMHGVFNVTASFEHVVRISMMADDKPFLIYVSLDQK